MGVRREWMNLIFLPFPTQFSSKHDAQYYNFLLLFFRNVRNKVYSVSKKETEFRKIKTFIVFFMRRERVFLFFLWVSSCLRLFSSLLFFFRWMEFVQCWITWKCFNDINNGRHHLRIHFLCIMHCVKIYWILKLTY